MKTAPLLRIRPDGTPEMLVAGTLADGPRYEASAEAAQAWAAFSTIVQSSSNSAYSADG